MIELGSSEHGLKIPKHTNRLFPKKTSPKSSKIHKHLTSCWYLDDQPTNPNCLGPVG